MDFGTEENLKKCTHCNKKGDSSTLKKCARCKSRQYCGTDCQRPDWRHHKKECIPEAEQTWYHKYRLCIDNSMHHGALELITWDGVCTDLDDAPMGWGNVFKEEAAAFREKYETEFGGDEARLFADWPQGFRWTCCGLSADAPHGCDHHGTGARPCRCDFCEMGQALPEHIYNAPKMERHGLTLPRGPDPRSFKGAAHVAYTRQMREAVGF